MDDCKAFRDHDIGGICEYLSGYCETHINATTPSNERVSAFYTFLPTLLIYVFGSPTSRGWMQTETRPEQDMAIRQLLRPSGAFFLALVKLGKYQEYSYDVTSESLPDDVRKALTAGAIQFLPSVYRQYTVYDMPATNRALDMRAAATRQSTIFPRSNVGEHRIKFNMLQFFLFYAVSSPTWTPLSVSTPTTALRASIGSTLTEPANPVNPSNTLLTPATKTPLNYTHNSVASQGSNTFALTPTAHRPPLQNTPLRPATPYSQPSDPKTPRAIAAPSRSPTSQVPGRYRSIIYGPYGEVIQDYMHHFIPIGRQRFHPDIDTFFLDCCIELWLRTAWIPPSESLSPEFIFVIQMLVKHIAGGDLRWAIGSVNDHTQRTDFSRVYSAVKDELYALFSRLAINWVKNGSFINVIELWSLWAAPWRLVGPTQSYTTPARRPIEEGWGDVVLDNALYYLSLGEIILQRTAVFTYEQGHMHLADMGSTFNTAQLRILQRFLNVMQTEGLVEFLANIETGLATIRTDGSAAKLSYVPGDQVNSDALDALAVVHCGSKTGVSAVQKLLQRLYDQLVQLGDGTQWKPSHIYSYKRSSRAKCLTATLDALYNAIETRNKKYSARADHNASAHQQLPQSAPPVAPAVESPKRSGDPLTEMNRTAELLSTVFKLRGVKDQASQTGIAAVAAAAVSFANSALKISDKATKPTATQTERMAGLEQKGFLTSEEKRQIKEGKIRCSYDSIPAVGPRAEEIVRSYEIAELVAWVVPFDRWMNRHYHQWVSPQNSQFLPARLTVRPLAAGINLVYLLALLFLLMWMTFGTKFAVRCVLLALFLLFMLKYGIH